MGEHDEHIVFEMGYNKGFKDGIKGSIPKEQYETRLKSDMVAMLTEIQLEIEEGLRGSIWFGLTDIKNIIQQKINSLKENTDGTNTD